MAEVQFVRIETISQIVGLPDDTPIRVNGSERTAGDYNHLEVAGTPLLEALAALGHKIEVPKA